MIDECPRCLYSLRGLPEEYACPECGLRYDGMSQSRRPKDLLLSLRNNSRWLFVAFFLAVGVTLLLVWTVRKYAPAGTGISPTPVQETTLFVMLGVCAAWWLGLLTLIVVYTYRFRCGQLVVATTLDGLYLRLDALPGRLYPWCKDTDVTVLSFVNMVLILSVRFRSGKTVSIQDCFDGMEDAEAFAESARAYIRGLESKDESAGGPTIQGAS